MATLMATAPKGTRHILDQAFYRAVRCTLRNYSLQHDQLLGMINLVDPATMRLTRLMELFNRIVHYGDLSNVINQFKRGGIPLYLISLCTPSRSTSTRSIFVAQKPFVPQK